MKKYIAYYYVPSQNIFSRGEFESESKVKLLSDLRELGYRIYNIVSIPTSTSTSTSSSSFIHHSLKF